jgi:hypothetical protein
LERVHIVQVGVGGQYRGQFSELVLGHGLDERLVEACAQEAEQVPFSSGDMGQCIVDVPLVVHARLYRACCGNLSKRLFESLAGCAYLLQEFGHLRRGWHVHAS